MTASEEADPGREALKGVYHVLAQRPHKDDDALTAIAQALCDWRDRMIGRHRAEPFGAEERGRLERLNAVLNTVLAVHFPSASVPWDELHAARGWLADLLAEVERTPA